MKKAKVLIPILSVCVFACSEQSDFTSPKSVTDNIQKIETSYYQGAQKNENISDGTKIETALDEASSEILNKKINNEIAASLSKLSDRYKNARTIFDGYDVGVIPNVDACPSWSEKITIFMDCEDGNSATRWIDDPTYQGDNYKGAWEIDGNKNVKMVFCRVDGREISHWNTSTPRAVLKLGSNFTTSLTLQRNFDNEDSNNKNYSLGDIGPNVSNSNTALFLAELSGCTTPCTNDSPDFGFGYGLIGGGGQYGFGWLFTDDEDKRNANRLYLNGRNAGSFYQENNIIVADANTQIFIYNVR